VFFCSSRGGGGGYVFDGASMASCGCRVDAIDARPGGASRRVLCVSTALSPRQKNEDTGPDLRHEQHDVRREAPVVPVVHDQRPGHPPGLQ
jgi:hypothetical protein